MIKIGRFNSDMNASEISQFCDNCEKHLGDGFLMPGGILDAVGIFQLKIFVPDLVNGGGTWYSKNKTLCDKCQQKEIDKFVEDITQIGFSKNISIPF